MGRPVAGRIPGNILPNVGGDRGVHGFFSLINLSMVAELWRGKYDAVLIHGHNLATNLIALFTAKVAGTRVFMRGDTHLLLHRHPLKRALRGSLMVMFTGYATHARTSVRVTAISIGYMGYGLATSFCSVRSGQSVICGASRNYECRAREAPHCPGPAAGNPRHLLCVETDVAEAPPGSFLLPNAVRCAAVSCGQTCSQLRSARRSTAYRR